MIVCGCRRVSDHDIRRAADEGAVSLECLQVELGVAMQRGRCADCASRVLCDARGVNGHVIPMGARLAQRADGLRRAARRGRCLPTIRAPP